MSLTKDGLSVKRFTEIFEEMNQGLKTLLGSSVDTSENSLVGHLNSNLSLRLTELWELSQVLYDAGDLRAAEGVALDNLALHVGVTRQPAKQSQGTLYFTGLNGVVIPSGSRVSSVKGDEYVTKESFAISSQRCLQTRIYVGAIIDSINYAIQMDDVGYIFNSGVAATEESILTGLKTQLDLAGTVTSTLVVDADTPANTYLLVDKDDKTSEMSVTGISYLKFDHVVSQKTVYSKEYGAISGDADAVTKILSSVTNWYSVTNPQSFKLGSGIETDNALRSRVLSEFNAAGTGTTDSIVTSVLRLDGVKNCIVKENATDVTVDGVPPKSYEVIVNGGITSEIAKVVWDTKPAGIYAHGSTVETITDFNGYSQQIRFSPADPKYVTVRVQYTTYDEEVLASGGIDAAKAAILKYANDTLTMDDDIIAKRFLGAIYSATPGFGDIDITVAYKDNPTDTVLVGDYAATLPISDRQFGSFSDVRIIFETM